MLKQMCIDGSLEPVPFTSLPLGKKKQKPTQAKGYAARPGTGPEGEKCKSCQHKYANEMRSGKRFWKCQLMRHAWTGGTGSDIRLSSPACSRWQQITPKLN